MLYVSVFVLLPFRHKCMIHIWGQGHVFDGKLHLTRDIYEDERIPKQLNIPTKHKPAKPAAKRAAKQAAQTCSEPWHTGLPRPSPAGRGALPLSPVFRAGAPSLCLLCFLQGFYEPG